MWLRNKYNTKGEHADKHPFIHTAAGSINYVQSVVTGNEWIQVMVA